MDPSVGASVRSATKEKLFRITSPTGDGARFGLLTGKIQTMSNTDYLKLAKISLDKLIDLAKQEKRAGPDLSLSRQGNADRSRSRLLEPAMLAAAIAQVEAIEQLVRETHLAWCANDPCSYADRLPFEEFSGENCVHGVNVGSACEPCVEALKFECGHAEYADGLCVACERDKKEFI